MSTTTSEVTAKSSKYAPFDPLQVYLLGFILGPVIVGVMLSLNWRRLGKPQRTKWMLLLTAALGVLIAIPNNVVFILYPSQRAFLILGLNTLFGIIFAAIGMRWQRSDYRAWKATQAAEPTFRQRGGCLSVLVLIVLTVAFSVTFNLTIGQFLNQTIFRPLTPALRPLTSFDDPILTLTYSTVWSPQAAEDNYYTCVQGKCLIILRYYIGPATIAFIQLDETQKALSLEEIDQQFLDYTDARYQDVKTLKTQTGVVDGEPALIRVLTRRSNDGNSTIEDAIYFIHPQNGSPLRIEVITREQESRQFQTDLQNIFNSIQFK